MADNLRQSSHGPKQRSNVKDKWLFQNINNSPFVCPPVFPQKPTISETMQANFYAAMAAFGKGFYKF
jgi:hypothetical protein